MRWYDYGFIALTIVIALWADYDAKVAFRSSVAVFLHNVYGEQDWIRSFDLYEIFGPTVFPVLRHLCRKGVVERKETSDDAGTRGGRPNAWYRWRRRDPPS